MKNIQMPERVKGKKMPSDNEMTGFVSYLIDTLGITLIVRPAKMVSPNEINTIENIEDIINYKSSKTAIDSKTLLLFFTALYELRDKVDVSDYVSYLRVFNHFPISYFMDEFGSGRLALSIDDGDLLHSLIETLKDLKHYVFRHHLT